ncbi:MAG: hypothetical protein ACRDRX_00620 [Pseudonocardiaceae bacterium]
MSTPVGMGAAHARRGDERVRGNIETCGDSLRVRVFAGADPVTGKPVYLRETVRGTDEAAHRTARRTLNRLIAEAEKVRRPSSEVSLRHVIDEWLRVAEHEDSTRDTYLGYIERIITPALGSMAISKLSARHLETLYAHLRRCRSRCAGKPFVEHRAKGEHDCAKARCAPHVCKPMAASTIRQIHSIISGALSAAVRWDWLETNPARGAQRPKQRLLSARGHLHLAQGRPDEAVADLRACGRGLAAWDTRNPWLCPWIAELVLALLARGDRAEALDTAAEAVLLGRAIRPRGVPPRRGPRDGW